MAESSVAVTPGSGKNLHTFNLTISGTSVEDEVMRLADQYLASYVIDQSASTYAANDHMLQIMAGGTNNDYVRRIRVFQSVVSTTATIVTWQIFRLTTAGTGGTNNAVDKLDETDAGAGATAMQIPTAKGTESTRLYAGTFATIQGLATTGKAETLLLDLDFDKNPRLKPIRIAAGTSNGIALKLVTAAANTQLQVIAEITEQNF